MQNWDDLEERTILPGMHGRFVHSDRMTFVLWRMDAGTKLPLHSHPHEQVVHLRSGELEVIVEGVKHVMTAGTVLVIPPNAPHEGFAVTEVSVMDAFAPVREDYLSGGTPILVTAAQR